MAFTQISDIIDPEVLADQISAKFPDKLVLGQSALVEVDTEFPLGSPGDKFKIPFWKRIGAFGDMTEGTPLTTAKIQTNAEYATVLRGGAAYEVLDTASLVSKADPVDEISNQVARRAAEYIDAKLTLELNKTPNTFNQNTSQIDSVHTMTQNAIITALVNTLGDNYAAVVGNGGAIIMHSKVYGDLLKTAAIQNQYQSGLDVIRTGLVPTLLGLPIFVSDLVTTTTSSVTTLYDTYVVGPGALGLFYQRQVMVEFDRDVLLKADVISADTHFAPHLFGYDDLGAAVVAEQNKSIHVVQLTSQ